MVSVAPESFIVSTTGPIWPRSLASPFDCESPFGQDVAHAIAQIALQFDAALDDGPARATGLLELLTQILQELIVLRQPVDDRDRLTSTSLFLHSELGHEARW